jgi:mannose-6-phosphate isomerase-like protein (cupin superfamily)
MARQWLAVLAVACGLLSGCLTKRQEAQLADFPRNRVFQPEAAPPLPEGKDHYFAEFDRGGSQSICLLRLAPDAALRKRYHAEHDLTLFVVSGSAIVEVEETRYFVTPGCSVLLPRLTAYAIMPNKSEKDFVAQMAFSPPLDKEAAEKDTFFED